MSKYVKRTAAAGLALIMILALASCGGTDKDDTPSGGAPANSASLTLPSASPSPEGGNDKDNSGGGSDSDSGSSFSGIPISAADASDLVQGNLDEIYLGIFDPDYLEMVQITENEAEETYLGGLEVETEYFLQYFSIEYPTDELKDEIMDFYKNLYANSSYTVGEASKMDDDTYAVKVDVNPLNIFELVNEDWDAGMETYYAAYADVDLDSLSDEEYQECDALWAQCILSLCWDKLPDVGYTDESKSVVLQVKRGSDGYWQIYGDDFSTLDEYMIYYP